jgi:hypothetical protein
MKIWIVKQDYSYEQDYNYEGTVLCGAFSTKEKAEAFAAAQSSLHVVDEFEVDALVSTPEPPVKP